MSLRKLICNTKLCCERPYVRLVRSDFRLSLDRRTLVHTYALNYSESSLLNQWQSRKIGLETSSRIAKKLARNVYPAAELLRLLAVDVMFYYHISERRLTCHMIWLSGWILRLKWIGWRWNLRSCSRLSRKASCWCLKFFYFQFADVNFSCRFVAQLFVSFKIHALHVWALVLVNL